MAREPYAAQVALLVRLLPFIAVEKFFALKGGTAINLFYRDMPRLSVDIDLTYLPVRDRAESLAEIDEALDRITAAANGGIAGLDARRIAGGGGGATRIRARLGNAEVKIETSPVTRGVVHDPELRDVSPAVEDEFGMRLSRSYRSKICLAASSMRPWIASTHAISLTSSSSTIMRGSPTRCSIRFSFTSPVRRVRRTNCSHRAVVVWTNPKPWSLSG